MIEMIKQFTIGLGADTNGLKQGLTSADSDISAFVSKAKGMLAGLGIGAGFAKLVSDFTNLGNDLHQFSDSTGIAVEDVSRLGLALEQFGGDTNTAKATLQGLQKSITQFAQTGSGAIQNAMSKYGVSVQKSNGHLKTANELYIDLANTMQGLSKEQQRDLGKSLGLDESSIKLLQQGRKGVEELLASRSDMAVITEEDARLSREWSKTIIDIKQSLMGFGREIVRACLPALQKFGNIAKKVTEFFNKNREAITHVGNIIRENLVPAFAFAVARIGMALKPLMLKLAPLMAIAAVIEDIAVFLQGGDSLLGEILGDSGEIIRTLINDIIGGLGGVVGSILQGDFRGAFEKLKGMWNESIIPLAKTFGQWLWGAISGIFPDLSGDLKEHFQNVSNFVKALFSGNFKEAGKILPKLLMSGWKSFLSVVGKIGSLVGDALSKVFPSFGAGFKSLFQNVTEFFKNLFSGKIRECFTNLAKLFTEVLFPLIGSLASFLWGVLKQLPGWIWNVLKVLPEMLWGVLCGLGDMLKEIVLYGLDSAIGLIADTWLGEKIGLDKVALSESKKREKGLLPAEASIAPTMSEDSLKTLSMAEKGEHIAGVTNSRSIINNSTPNLNNNVTINQTFTGETNPEAVKQAAKTGTTRSLKEAPSYAPTLAFMQ